MMKAPLNLIWRALACGLVLSSAGLLVAAEAPSKPATRSADPWAEWRAAARMEGRAEVKVGRVIFQEDFQGPLQEGWGKHGPTVAKDGDNTVLRQSAGAPTATLVVKGLADRAPNGFEASFRIRLGQVPPKIVSGQGGLIQVGTASKSATFGFMLQAAYMRGGSWLFNGLALRSGGGKVEFQKELLKAGPATLDMGPPIDAGWHALALRCREQRIEVLWDGEAAYAAEDPRIPADQFTFQVIDPQAVIGHFDVDDLVIRILDSPPPNNHP